MTQSVTDACNSALQKIGASRILSINDSTVEALACAVAFDSNRRDELRKHVWKFATKRAQLAPDVKAPLFDDTYAFSLPSDCLRIVFPADPDLDWKLEGRKIITSYGSGNGAVLNLRYVADITDCTQWDSSFYNVFAISLALDLVEALTQSTGKKSSLAYDYRDAIMQARAADAFETMPQQSADSSWLTVRTR